MTNFVLMLYLWFLEVVVKPIASGIVLFGVALLQLGIPASMLRVLCSPDSTAFREQATR